MIDNNKKIIITIEENNFQFKLQSNKLDLNKKWIGKKNYIIFLKVNYFILGNKIKEDVQ